MNDRMAGWSRLLITFGLLTLYASALAVTGYIMFFGHMSDVAQGQIQGAFLSLCTGVVSMSASAIFYWLGSNHAKDAADAVATQKEASK